MNQVVKVAAQAAAVARVNRVAASHHLVIRAVARAAQAKVRQQKLNKPQHRQF